MGEKMARNSIVATMSGNVFKMSKIINERSVQNTPKNSSSAANKSLELSFTAETQVDKNRLKQRGREESQTLYNKKNKKLGNSPPHNLKDKAKSFVAANG